jgi:hypothetical protein
MAGCLLVSCYDVVLMVWAFELKTRVLRVLSVTQTLQLFFLNSTRKTEQDDPLVNKVLKSIKK